MSVFQFFIPDPEKKSRRFVFLLVMTLTLALAHCGRGDGAASGSGADKLMNGGSTSAKSPGKKGGGSAGRTSTVALPKGPRWKSRVYRLRVRSAPTLRSEIVGHLHKGQLVAELESKSSSVTVSGRKGRWLKIKSDTNVVGWTFSGFLTKVQ